SRQQKVAKGISNPLPKEIGRGIAIIGTGLSSTLLSSQRTTAHRRLNLVQRFTFEATVQVYLVVFARRDPEDLVSLAQVEVAQADRPTISAPGSCWLNHSTRSVSHPQVRLYLGLRRTARR
ncbi:hypothetical protein, partial [Actinoplanes regularis]|uniref:hypothetical protein n=1 Tax=Actinoplanes regularis TaxID=52697 RepID=UPI0025544D3D